MHYLSVFCIIDTVCDVRQKFQNRKNQTGKRKVVENLIFYKSLKSYKKK